MPRVSKIVAGIGAAAVCGVIALTVMCGYVKGLPVFELFTKGAAEGMHTAIKLLPTLLGLIVGISMLRASGFLELFSALLRPVTEVLNIPTELMPLILLRPLSGSGSVSYVTELYSAYGADSVISRLAAILSSSTETTFYAAAVYFRVGGIKRCATRFRRRFAATLPPCCSRCFRCGFLGKTFSVRFCVFVIYCSQRNLFSEGKGMLLALDVGNTNITLGVYEGEKLLFVTRMATNPPRMEDEYASAMLSILHLYNIHTSQVNGAVLSSVVPRLTDDLARAVRRVWKVEPFIVSAQSVPELKVKRDVPNTLGADLVVGAVAAKAMYHGPCIVIDMGTATTLTGLNADGEVCGVVIIPGVGTSLDALTSRAAQLSSVSLTAPPQVLGRNTMECIQSGMVFGTACMLDGLCDRIEDELGAPCEVVATGGLAGLIVPHCSRKITFSDTLLLDGLKIIWDAHGEK